jgi:hypothetical protein
MTIKGAASRLVEVFGQNYWMNLSQKELDEYWPNACTKIDGIHTDEAINALVAAQMDSDFDLYAA